jgi:paraquat-inducible protein A
VESAIDSSHGDRVREPPLVACHECDLLQREVELPEGGAALCARCGAHLYRSTLGSVDRALAYTAAGAVFFVLANTFPLVGLRLNGELIQTTLYGTAKAMYLGDMRTVAAVVFVTIFVAPLIELIALAGLLLPLKFPSFPPAGARVYRTLRAITPWRMTEVMMLGVLVALVKLAHLAEVMLGVALWSLGGLVVMLAAAASTFEPRIVWARVDELR